MNKNTKTTLWALPTAVALCVGAWLFSSQQAHPASATSPAVGRYMLVRASDTVTYCIDTETGDVWSKRIAGTNWVQDGNAPMQKPGVPY